MNTNNLSQALLPALAGAAVASLGFLAFGNLGAKKKNRTIIRGAASSFPVQKYKQSEVKEAFLKRHDKVLSDSEKDFVTRVFDHTDIESCHIALPAERLFEKFNREQYVTHIKTALKDLGLRAAKQALAEWGGDVSTLTHIVWGTMTGAVHAPTMDVEMLQALGLPNDAKRLNVEGMGCLTGYRCLGLANAFVREDPEKNKVLVIVCDTRSVLGNQLQETPDRSDIVVCALFRDSGGAVVVTGDNATDVGKPLFEIIEHNSYCVPNSFDYVALREKDNSVMHLYISKEVPVAVGKCSPPIVERMLAKHGVPISECAFSLHTGGPKVLNFVGDALKLVPDQLAASWQVMRERGNLSGSSNLVVLDHIRKVEQTKKYKYVVCLSFGPGVCVEILLLRAL